MAEGTSSYRQGFEQGKMPKKKMDLNQEEILLRSCQGTTHFSVVISNLQDYVQPTFISPKIYVYDDNKKTIKKAQNGEPYMKYPDGEREMDMTKSLVCQFTTMNGIYENLTGPQKTAVNMIKSFINSLPCTFWWHNGDADDKCQFHGLHIHLIVVQKEDLMRAGKYCTMRRVLNTLNIQCKYQRIRNVDALTKHLQTPPRVLLGCNNLDLIANMDRISSQQLISYYDEDAETEIAQLLSADMLKPGVSNKPDFLRLLTEKLQWQEKEMTVKDKLESNKRELTFKEVMSDKPIVEGYQSDLRTTKTAHKVDVLKKFFVMFRKTETEDILEAIMDTEDKEMLNEWRSLTLLPTFNNIRVQALMEMKVEKRKSGANYLTELIDRPLKTVNCHSVQKTGSIFVEWCNEQCIDYDDFLVKLYMVLGCRNPKVNCFMLQGASNAGKTYWAKAVTPHPDLVGQTVQSQDFIWQKCLHKGIIMIPELTIVKPEVCEEMKKVFEGFNVMINVKNKEPQILYRTPIEFFHIVTSP